MNSLESFTGILFLDLIVSDLQNMLSSSTTRLTLCLIMFGSPILSRHLYKFEMQSHSQTWVKVISWPSWLEMIIGAQNDGLISGFSFFLDSRSNQSDLPCFPQRKHFQIGSGFIDDVRVYPFALYAGDVMMFANTCPLFSRFSVTHKCSLHFVSVI